MKWMTITGMLFCCTNITTLYAQSPVMVQDSTIYKHVVEGREIIFIRPGCFPCGKEKEGEYEKARKAFARKIIENERKSKQVAGMRNYYVVVYCGKLNGAGAPVRHGLIFRRIYPQPVNKRKGAEPRRTLPPQRV